jgi:hypothetical protein
VKQYLSESFKSSESLHNLLPYPVLQHKSTMAAVASKSQPATTCNSPILRANSKLFNHASSSNNNGGLNNGGTTKNNNLSHSATEMAHLQSLEYSSGHSTTSSFPFIFQHRYVTASPDHGNNNNNNNNNNNPMSPTISSVATSVSASEVSEKKLF